MRKFAAFFFILAALALTSRAQTSQNSNSVTFTVVALPAVPTIATVAPTQAYIGTATTLTLTGTNFTNTCTATYDAAAITSTFVSATSITISVPAAKVTLGTHALIINCPVPILTMTSPVTLPNAQVGVSYSASLQTISGLKGGVPPYSFSLSSGSLPTGLTLSSSGNVVGTPSGAGAFNFGFTVKDSSGLAAKFERTFTAKISSGS
jgi:hypothetical protein